MKLIHSLNKEEITEVLKQFGAPAFRTKQIWNWLYVNKVTNWDDMANLPAKLRTQLSSEYSISPASVDEAGNESGTLKFLLNFDDGEQVEIVLIPARKRYTVCVSSQAGCKYKCAFCASGQAGFSRNLEAGEIIAQYLQAASMADAPVTHVVFMGIGEPFDNYDNVMKAIRILNDKDGLNIGARRITISTCGLIKGIEKLAKENLQVELSLSLHAPNQRIREYLMPVASKESIADLLVACREYFAETKRIITLEYTLIKGLNDSEHNAHQLLKLIRHKPFRVNLIPLSPVAEFQGERPEKETMLEFMDILTNAGVNVTLRDSRGSQIKAACGQLRYSNKDK
ncbi:MAG: 23S rRNA (adenine(2503)-C(2))-methyltransferase RlmN [Kiritimatiellae bacterium]|jgi:23S rRNA (adenine2503-C2)-methyltransferase|nr:23S rRNA (adenine(2503)-C(2))-methyltransferase RlmN [Kiritimatiellia bacterium]